MQLCMKIKQTKMNRNAGSRPTASLSEQHPIEASSFQNFRRSHGLRGVPKNNRRRP